MANPYAKKNGLRALATAIAEREGKKHQASIGDVREILKVMIDICAEEHGDYAGFGYMLQMEIARRSRKLINKQD